MRGFRAESGPDARRDDLLERVKELNCLFLVARILGTHTLPLKQMLRQIVEVIPPAWQDPERTMARIGLQNLLVESSHFVETPQALTEDLRIDGRKVGFIETRLRPEPAPRGPESSGPADPFLENERELLEAIARLIENTVLQKEAAAALKRTAAELQSRKTQLEHKNIALREILAQVEIEKRELMAQVKANVEQLVKPLIRKLLDPGLPADMKERTLDLLERNLGELASTYSRTIVDDRVRLSPRELEVAAMVRDGFSSKEIAGQLHLSELTVERHRHNIRRKLGIASKQVNLSTYLRQL